MGLQLNNQRLTNYDKCPLTKNEETQDASGAPEPIEWLLLRRREPTSVLAARPNQFYPIFVDDKTGRIQSIGDPITSGIDRHSVVAPEGTVAVWPLKPDGDFASFSW